MPNLWLFIYLFICDKQADWGPSGGRAAAAPSYGEAEAEEEGSKSMVLTTHTIMRVSLSLWWVRLHHTKPNRASFCCTRFFPPSGV